MILLVKYWRFALPVVLFAIVFSAYNYHIADIKSKAQEAIIEKVTEQAKEQIKQDIEIVRDAFSPSPTINGIVDEILSRDNDEEITLDTTAAEPYRLQSDADSNEGGLLGTREKTTTDNGSETRPDSVLQSGLSDSEIEQINKFTDLLQ